GLTTSLPRAPYAGSMNAARIFVVDDEPQIRRVMRATLAGAGYVVADARSGGIEPCRKIRAQSDVHVLMLTVRNSNQDAVEALDAGADDYVTKPFSMEVLLARVRA